MKNTDSNQLIEELITKYQNLVFSICLKHVGDYFVAEDLAQETFISFYTHLDTFNGENAKAYLARIASNKCIDYLRSAERRSIPTDDESMPEVVADTPEPLTEYMNSEVLNNLKEIIEDLPEIYKDIGLLYFLDNKPPKDIAAVLNINLKTVQTRIYRCQSLLKENVRREDLL